MISSVREYRCILAVLTSVAGLAPWSGQKSNIHVLLLSDTAGPRQKSRFTPTELLRSHPYTTSDSFIFRTVNASPVPTLRRETTRLRFSTLPRGEKFKTRKAGGIFRARANSAHEKFKTHTRGGIFRARANFAHLIFHS